MKRNITHPVPGFKLKNVHWGYWLALLAILAGGIKMYAKTRGYRNNNPGNLRDQGIAWHGLVGHDEKGFAIFDSPENGLRAMLVNAYHLMQRQGADTLYKLGHLWAPPSDNAGADDYGHKLASQIGIDPNQKIDVGTIMPQLAKAITVNENGIWMYPKNTVDTAIYNAKIYLGIA